MNYWKWGETINKTRLDFAQLEDTKNGTINVSIGKDNKIKIWYCHLTLTKLLPIIESEFGNEYNYCHYVTPNTGVLHVLEGIETKAKDLTEIDYFVSLLVRRSHL